MGPGGDHGWAGAIPDGNTAFSFAGRADSIVYRPDAITGPSTFSGELWFRTTSTTGGELISFGNSMNANSSVYDRLVYLVPDGRLVAGVYPGAMHAVTSPRAYIDGQWHHMVMTVGSGDLNLYLDGVLVAADPGGTSGERNVGYRPAGGDTVNGWPGTAATTYSPG